MKMVKPIYTGRRNMECISVINNVSEMPKEVKVKSWRTSCSHKTTKMISYVVIGSVLA